MSEEMCYTLLRDAEEFAQCPVVQGLRPKQSQEYSGSEVDLHILRHSQGLKEAAEG
jgi:hypothetical protein